jgi:hypothetical protein
VRRHFAGRLYDRLARREVLELLRVQNGSASALVHVLRTFKRNVPPSLTWVHGGLANDGAPALYAFALRFL